MLKNSMLHWRGGASNAILRVRVKIEKMLKR